MSMADLMERRAQQLYRHGQITRAEYARQVGRIRRIERARLGLASVAVAAALFLAMGGLFS